MNPTIRTRAIAGGLLSVAMACFLVAAAAAADFPYRALLDQGSRARGLNATGLPLLQRQPGRGARTVADEILLRYRVPHAALTTAGASTRDVNTARVRYTGAAGWFLIAYGDGTAVRYRNYAFLDSTANPLRPVAERLSSERLETLGRDFIARELSSYVVLAEDEELHALSTVHQISGTQPNMPGAPTEEEEVGGSIVSFIRTVGGVAVVGRGSKVAVVFANDGTPVGFDFDWPTYATTGETQRVLDVAAINRRASTGTSVDPFGRNAVIRRYECGYFDAGARRLDRAAPIQTACFLQYVTRTVGDPERNQLDPTDGLYKAGWARAVPAGVIVKADHGWPEAMRLCVGKPGCGLPLSGARPPSDGSPRPSIGDPGL